MINSYLQSAVAGGDDFVENDDEKIGVIPREYWYVHGNSYRVRFVETHAEIPFTAQQ